MLFNSLTFVIFFLIAYAIFWKLNYNLKLQNGFLLLASCVFYGWWDIRFLVLLFAAAMIDFYFGHKIYDSNKPNERKFYIWLSAALNLGLLGYFKYLNFFIDSFVLAMNSIGYHPNIHTLNIILPVGISYYTFQSMSYSLDIYKNKFKPVDDVLEYMTFICFFPQLVAGPVERASFLLPQFYKKKIFNYQNSIDGLRLMLYGFFKKIVLADNIALRVDPVFSRPADYTGIEVYLGAIFFCVQLYCDLSGYADIARGTAKLLDFELSPNFQTPFFSTSIPETWRRWHITITTWFRDYFFIPVVKMRISHTAWKIFTTLMLFVIIGFWHDADWKFLVFGLLVGIEYIPNILSKDYDGLRKVLKFFNTNKYIKPVSIFFTFSLFALTGVFFRADGVGGAIDYYAHIFEGEFWGIRYFFSDMLNGIALFLVYEWFMQHKAHQFEVSAWHPALRKLSYATLILLILLLGHFGEDPFYYFKF